MWPSFGHVLASVRHSLPKFSGSVSTRCKTGSKTGANQPVRPAYYSSWRASIPRCYSKSLPDQLAASQRPPRTTSLVDRIKYDLYSIENGSAWFDLQILLLTFSRNKNAY